MRRGPLYGYIQLQIVWLVTGGLSLQGKNTVIELKLDDDRVVSVWGFEMPSWGRDVGPLAWTGVVTFIVTFCRFLCVLLCDYSSSSVLC